MTYIEKVNDFLNQKTLAVAGVSTDSDGSPANGIFLKLKNADFTVFGTNPKGGTFSGELKDETCYTALTEIPEKVDGVVAVVRPDKMIDVVEECSRAGITRIWMHRSFGSGSVSDDAVRAAEEKGMTVLAGGCPMMFCKPVDFGHKCIKLFAKWTGKFPGN